MGPEMPQVHAHHSPVVVTYTDAGRITRPDGTPQGGQLVFIANAELLQGREPNMSLISWHSSRLKRVARPSSAAETQAAAGGDDEAVYVCLSLKEVQLGQLDLQNWRSEARQIPAALVVDCHGVYDALSRSSSSCLGFKDKKYGLEALALKQSLVEFCFCFYSVQRRRLRGCTPTRTHHQCQNAYDLKNSRKEEGQGKASASPKRGKTHSFQHGASLRFRKGGARHLLPTF